MECATLHRQLVEAAELAGVTQCIGVLWKDAHGQPLWWTPANAPRVAACNELGLLFWGEELGVVTERERIALHEAIAKRVGSLVDANDRGMTFEQFTELLT